MTDLKEQIASRSYRVDSGAVAREMLFKIRMMAVVLNQQRHADAAPPEDLGYRRSWSNPNGSRTDPSG